MQYITETNQIPVRHQCEVCVCGGGIAGIAAALAAARAGAKTILLEREFMLGGLATAGIVTIYLPLCDGMGNQVCFGIAEELLHLSIQYGAEARYPKAWLEDGTLEERANGPRFEVQYNPHLFAISAEQLLLKEGVKILYGTVVCNVRKSGDHISELIVESKSGREAIGVRSMVDATGDADICKFAGEKTQTFQQGNVLAAWYYYANKGKINLKMLGFADIPDEYKNVQKAETPLIAQRYTGLDAEEVSGMVQCSHRFILEDILKKRKNGDSELIPSCIPSIPQLRMTRRICGCYTMDDKEIRKEFPDSVGVFSDWRKRGPVYQLPFCALYGEHVANLITAGRCISSSESMWDITRVIPVCAVSGEAAGNAAAMSDDFKTLDVAKLQRKLCANGAKIEF